jgi:cephalosporin hydroxylase
MKTPTLYALYRKHRQEQTDINEHLEILSRLASLCDHVTEFGVRSGRSTSAILHGKPQKLISYDIRPLLNLDIYVKSAKAEGVEFEFIQADTVKMNPISKTDLLFIDTTHTYNHLNAELAIHSQQVSKFLVVHDTSIFGDFGQNGERGIWPAIAEFLKQNSKWRLWQYFTHNNGLTILCCEPMCR